MEMEDPRLHETAEMWKSSQHQINIGAMAFIVMLFFMGAIVCGIFLWTGFAFDEIPVFVIGVMFIGPIIGVIIYVIYTNSDKKDHWALSLPYNSSLYYRLEALVEPKFAEKAHRYVPIAQTGISALQGLNSVRGAVRAYALQAPGGSSIEVRFGLQVIRHKSSTSYLFPMEIRNVRMENIEFARRVQGDLMEVLIGVDFLTYQEEH